MKKWTRRNIIIVIEDTYYLDSIHSFKNDNVFKSIFLNGRMHNLFVIMTQSFALRITPELRENIDYVFMFNETCIKHRKMLFEAYGTMFTSFENFCGVLDACTEDYKCLVIDRTKTDIKTKSIGIKPK